MMSHSNLNVITSLVLCKAKFPEFFNKPNFVYSSFKANMYPGANLNLLYVYLVHERTSVVDTVQSDRYKRGLIQFRSSILFTVSKSSPSTIR